MINRVNTNGLGLLRLLRSSTRFPREGAGRCAALVPSPITHHRRSSCFTSRIGLAHGEVWATPPPITGVASWLAPTHSTPTQEDRDAAGWREVEAAWGSAAVARYQAFVTDMRGAVGSLAPQPHWHL